MKISIELKGSPDKVYCSEGSSINSCQYLNTSKEKCKLFKIKLKYDWDEHAYKRCLECINNEVE